MHACPANDDDYRHNIVKLVCGTVMKKFVINYRIDARKTNVNLLIRTMPYKWPAHTINSLLTPFSLPCTRPRQWHFWPLLITAHIYLGGNLLSIILDLNSEYHCLAFTDIACFKLSQRTFLQFIFVLFTTKKSARCLLSLLNSIDFPVFGNGWILSEIKKMNIIFNAFIRHSLA